MKKNYEKCSLCAAGPFSPHGLKVHAKSARCVRRQSENDVRIAAEEARERLVMEGKVPVPKYIINALLRRRAGQVCGVTCGKTRYEEGYHGADAEAREEWWVYEWVSKLYSKHRRTWGFRGSGTAEFYKRVDEIMAMNADEREAAVNMILLSVY